MARLNGSITLVAMRMIARDQPLEADVLSCSEQSETILLVDDDPTVRMLVSDVLQDLGYTVIEAADSVAGLKILGSGARIDLLVTDVGLPGGMNGRQMAHVARQTRPTLRVLFITGYTDSVALQDGHLDAGMAVIAKPFSIDILATRVNQMIHVS